jgi:hypothetical protein
MDYNDDDGIGYDDDNKNVAFIHSSTLLSIHSSTLPPYL